MNDVLTREEIESRFDGEWILMEDPELAPDREIVRGKVVWHSKDRDEVYEKAFEVRPRHPRFLFVGAPPEDMEFVL
jgi:hypothetical protein